MQEISTITVMKSDTEEFRERLRYWDSVWDRVGRGLHRGKASGTWKDSKLSANVHPKGKRDDFPIQTMRRKCNVGN